eukprot:2405848-Pyramimonas_sp.AAC.1
MAKTRADVNRADMQTKSLEEPKFMTLLATFPLWAPPPRARAGVRGAAGGDATQRSPMSQT